MSSYGFTSAFATPLDEYLAFKKNMGFYGGSRIWYLKRFDAYCTERGRAVFDRDTVEAWVSAQLATSARTGRGCRISVTSAAGSVSTGARMPTCCPTSGRRRSCRPIPICSLATKSSYFSLPRHGSGRSPHGGGSLLRSSR